MFEMEYFHEYSMNTVFFHAVCRLSKPLTGLSCFFFFFFKPPAPTPPVLNSKFKPVIGLWADILSVNCLLFMFHQGHHQGQNFLSCKLQTKWTQFSLLCVWSTVVLLPWCRGPCTHQCTGVQIQRDVTAICHILSYITQCLGGVRELYDFIF